MATLIPVTLYLATIEFNVFVFVIWIMFTVCLLIFALGNYLDSKITSSENLPGTVYTYSEVPNKSVTFFILFWDFFPPTLLLGPHAY